ncbi:MAG: hypothetical protein R2875_10930 [Desulfobacterales bacterium]
MLHPFSFFYLEIPIRYDNHYIQARFWENVNSALPACLQENARESTEHPLWKTQKKIYPPMEQAARDLFDFSVDRTDIKQMMAILHEQADIERTKVEYELPLFKNHHRGLEHFLFLSTMRPTKKAVGKPTGTQCGNSRPVCPKPQGS